MGCRGGLAPGSAVAAEGALWVVPAQGSAYGEDAGSVSQVHEGA